MVNGNNHAKQILIEDTLAHVKKLENGSAGDIAIIGRTLSKVAKISCAMYENDFRTVESCEDIRKSDKSKNTKTAKLKVGPVSIEGPITTTLLLNSIPLVCCGILLFALGKIQNWR